MQATIVLVILLNNSIAMYDMESKSDCLERRDIAIAKLKQTHKPETFTVQCLYKLGGFAKQS